MNAIPYFLSNSNTPANENCKLYFDFNVQAPLYTKVLNLTGSAPSYNGDINSLNQFWVNSGSGTFSGEYVSITGNNDPNVNIIHNDITFCLVYENLSSHGAVLISTVETGVAITYTDYGLSLESVIFKGFNFGVTANNRLFFEYYNDNKLDTYTSNFSLAQKTSVYLTIFNNLINFGYYDFFRNELVDESFFIESDFLFDYPSVYLGYNDYLNNTKFFNNKFTGYMDEFLIFSPSIYSNDIVDINSGLAYIYNSGVDNVISTIVTGITGYESGVTGYVQGVTGTVLVANGTATNDWGVEYTVYIESGVTGLIPQYGVTGLTGIISIINETEGVGGSLEFKSDYINSFGKQVINCLSDFNNNDILEIQLLTQEYTGVFYEKNIVGQFLPFVNKFGIDNKYLDINKRSAVFVNGQLNVSGDYYYTGNGYVSGLAIQNDYYIDSIIKEISFKNAYDENSSVILDFIDGVNPELYYFNFFVESGVGSLNLTGWYNDLYNIYFNGQKLISGIHFTPYPDGISFSKQSPLYSGITGTLSAFNKFSNYIITGNTNSYEFDKKYLYNLSEIYKNGLRLTLGSDYLELSALDVNTGSGFFDIKTDFIYNNEGLFNL